MKVFLKARATTLYVRGDNEWTPDRALALNFRTTVEAIQFFGRSGLRGMCLVLAHDDDPASDAYMPLTDLSA